jgi:hypothetical protein
MQTVFIFRNEKIRSRATYIASKFERIAIPRRRIGRHDVQVTADKRNDLVCRARIFDDQIATARLVLDLRDFQRTAVLGRERIEHLSNNRNRSALARNVSGRIVLQVLRFANQTTKRVNELIFVEMQIHSLSACCRCAHTISKRERKFCSFARNVFNLLQYK